MEGKCGFGFESDDESWTKIEIKSDGNDARESRDESRDESRESSRRSSFVLVGSDFSQFAVVDDESDAFSIESFNTTHTSNAAPTIDATAAISSYSPHQAEAVPHTKAIKQEKKRDFASGGAQLSAVLRGAWKQRLNMAESSQKSNSGVWTAKGDWIPPKKSKRLTKLKNRRKIIKIDEKRENFAAKKVQPTRTKPTKLRVCTCESQLSCGLCENDSMKETGKARYGLRRRGHKKTKGTRRFKSPYRYTNGRDSIRSAKHKTSQADYRSAGGKNHLILSMMVVQIQANSTHFKSQIGE